MQHLRMRMRMWMYAYNTLQKHCTSTSMEKIVSIHLYACQVWCCPWVNGIACLLLIANKTYMCVERSNASNVKELLMISASIHCFYRPHRPTLPIPFPRIYCKVKLRLCIWLSKRTLQCYNRLMIQIQYIECCDHCLNVLSSERALKYNCADSWFMLLFPNQYQQCDPHTHHTHHTASPPTTLPYMCTCLCACSMWSRMAHDEFQTWRDVCICIEPGLCIHVFR